MPTSSLDHLVNLVDQVVGQLRKSQTENEHLKEEIRRLEQELEGLKEDLGVRRGEVARLRRTRKRVKVLAERVLDHLTTIENSNGEIDVTG